MHVLNPLFGSFTIQNHVIHSAFKTIYIQQVKITDSFVWALSYTLDSFVYNKDTKTVFAFITKPTENQVRFISWNNETQKLSMINETCIPSNSFAVKGYIQLENQYFELKEGWSNDICSKYNDKMVFDKALW